MKSIAVILLASSVAHAAIAAEPSCSQDATAQAKKLLTFHIDMDLGDRMEFGTPTLKPPIKNPMNPEQKFTVLEVNASVSPHGVYRMRFIYFRLYQGSCLLMGQEILEYANP